MTLNNLLESLKVDINIMIYIYIWVQRGKSAKRAWLKQKTFQAFIISM